MILKFQEFVEEQEGVCGESEPFITSSLTIHNTPAIL
jgi:hypothetical protein